MTVILSLIIAIFAAFKFSDHAKDKGLNYKRAALQPFLLLFVSLVFMAVCITVLTIFDKFTGGVAASSETLTTAIAVLSFVLFVTLLWKNWQGLKGA